MGLTLRLLGLIPLSRKEVGGLLAKSVTEQFTGGAHFYSNVFVVSKCTCGLQPILKCFNFYMHIPTFKMPTIREVQILIQQGDYAISIDLKDAYLHIPIVKHPYHFYHLLGNTKLFSGRFCHFN